jgi:hypothetical protein
VDASQGVALQDLSSYSTPPELIFYQMLKFCLSGSVRQSCVIDPRPLWERSADEDETGNRAVIAEELPFAIGTV